jgi:hypothetical protein
MVLLCAMVRVPVFDFNNSCPEPVLEVKVTSALMFRFEP